MADEKFHLVSNYAPTGDQPQAIEQLVEGVERGDRCQTLLGVTGSGKTFTMANVIARCNRPTLVLAHNKTLAAQLCTEFRSFFPDNAVEYFVSYYDYYQPEAYIPSTDTYIEKDSAINDEIDRLRHSATAALSERRDVIIVASVSCIYSLGDPIDYRSMVISLRPGMQMERDDLCKKLVTLQYERNDINFIRNKFRGICTAHGVERERHAAKAAALIVCVVLRRGITAVRVIVIVIAVRIVRVIRILLRVVARVAVFIRRAGEGSAADVAEQRAVGV